MIELNKKYSGKEVAKELFNISPNTFNVHKEDYIKYMDQFFE